jgi:hypothetical protein
MRTLAGFASASGKTEKDFFLASTRLRDGLMKKIPSYAALFAPAQ